MHKNSIRAQQSIRFFKTKIGQYGYADRFLGVSVPQIRSIVCLYKTISLQEIKALLASVWHEERLAGAIILANQAKQYNHWASSGQAKLKKICTFYLRNVAGINNWDLVDVSAGHVVGGFLASLSIVQQKQFLTSLIQSKNIWERRIAMISTFYFIKKGKSHLALWVAKQLLDDDHDLIHKAVGWMLREVGKHCGEKALCVFLEKHVRDMSRTTLRYAIEKLSYQKKKNMMNL